MKRYVGFSAKIGEDGFIPLHEEPKLVKVIDFNDKKVVDEEPGKVAGGEDTSVEFDHWQYSGINTDGINECGVYIGENPCFSSGLWIDYEECP